MKFSDEDHLRIRQTVTAAERQTRGEIVPMVIERSALYREARYRAGIGCAIIMLGLLLTVEWEGLPWGWHSLNAGWLILSIMASYGLGYWLGTFGPIIRLLTSNERMAYKVNMRAHQAFLEQGLHRTELGSGVLILVSLLEHRIEVLTGSSYLRSSPSTHLGRYGENY